MLILSIKSSENREAKNWHLPEIIKEIKIIQMDKSQYHQITSFFKANARRAHFSLRKKGEGFESSKVLLVTISSPMNEQEAEKWKFNKLGSS